MFFSWLHTKEEIDELIEKCQCVWTEPIGANGYKVTDPNGNSIFLPAAGWRIGYPDCSEIWGIPTTLPSLIGAGNYGNYWSATPDGGNVGRAYSLYFGSDTFVCRSGSRSCGWAVRAVTK